MTCMQFFVVLAEQKIHGADWAGYENTNPETNEATPDADPQDTPKHVHVQHDHGDKPGDTELAEAHGVPTSCMVRHSPWKNNG